MNHQCIAVHAPTTSYCLVFKHLRGYLTVDKDRPYYLSGTKEFTEGEVIELLMESNNPLPPEMVKGHTLATAAYICGTRDCRGDFAVGVALVPGPNHKVTKHQLRRAALTEAVAGLPAVDRAYFHLVLSGMEGRDMQPILRKVLHRKRTDSVQLVHHVVTTENPLLTHIGE